jgi:hypothetical protein
MKKQKKKKMGPPPVSFSSHKQTNKQKGSKQASRKDPLLLFPRTMTAPLLLLLDPERESILPVDHQAL